MPDGLDFTAIPGYQQHSESPQPAQAPQSVMPKPDLSPSQYVKNLETQTAGEKQYSDWLYQNSPDEYRKANPIDYFVRKVHGVINDAAMRGVEHDPEYLRTGAAPYVHELANVIAGQVGKEGGVGRAQGLMTSTIPRGMAVLEEEPASPKLDFSAVAGHQEHFPAESQEAPQTTPTKATRGPERRQTPGSWTEGADRRLAARRAEEQKFMGTKKEEGGVTTYGPERPLTLPEEEGPAPDYMSQARGLDMPNMDRQITAMRGQLARGKSEEDIVKNFTKPDEQLYAKFLLDLMKLEPKK